MRSKISKEDLEDKYIEKLEIVESEYQGRKVKLNDPFRLPSGSNKKFGVYVKNEKDIGFYFSPFSVPSSFSYFVTVNLTPSKTILFPGSPCLWRPASRVLPPSTADTAGARESFTFTLALCLTQKEATPYIGPLILRANCKSLGTEKWLDRGGGCGERKGGEVS